MEIPLSQYSIHVPLLDIGLSKCSEFFILYQAFSLLSCVDVYSWDITCPLHGMLWDTVLGMVGLSMGGHERPYGLVPKTWD